MNESKEKIKQECGKRLDKWLTSIKMPKKKLAHEINCTQQHISYVIHGKRTLSKNIAELISNKTEQISEDGELFSVNPQWLLCESEDMTNIDRIESGWKAHKQIMNKQYEFSFYASHLIEAAADRVYHDDIAKRKLTESSEKKNDPQPVIHPDIPETDLSKMRAMLESYAYNLAYSYLFNREYDPLWNAPKEQ